MTDQADPVPVASGPAPEATARGPFEVRGGGGRQGGPSIVRPEDDPSTRAAGARTFAAAAAARVVAESAAPLDSSEATGEQAAPLPSHGDTAGRGVGRDQSVGDRVVGDRVVEDGDEGEVRASFAELAAIAAAELAATELAATRDAATGQAAGGDPGAGALVRQGDHAVEAVDAGEATLAPLLLHSLADLREIWVPLIEASGARSVAEIGSESGVTTSLLVDLLRRGGGGRLVVVDPNPGVEPAAGGGLDVQVIRGYSPQALDGHAPTDAYLIDGDHNYATVRGELAAIADAVDRFGRSYFPMVILHDVGWPAGRRDQYYAPDRIAADDRQPHSWDVGVEIDNAGVVPGGFRGMGAFAWALTEGGPRNGVRTAVEDFLAEQPELRFFTVAPIFGLGVLVDRRAPWARQVADLLTPWVSNRLLSRLERNRVDLYLHVLRLQDTAAAVARARQREWSRLDDERSRLAATELAHLQRVAELEEELARLRRTEAERAAAGPSTGDERTLVQVARLAGAALRSKLGPGGQEKLSRVQTRLTDSNGALPALRRRSGPPAAGGDPGLRR
ncbi:class I SAM-dependent methyltransferase [Frankia sp. AgB32]|uniref:class I SAM-dependent methyltransferase n=1 Tax=Frankia sp. AgB32 TaxID=631119 RepID=UPI00200CFEA7|nr:class I SAM-dependent methyltransferase [Frankia sp. AgB32]MCK9893823.1 class I SAM-dependent methyltransferase [Frankia sp. AgB32]